jgi:GT2 family glycosyltransferase
MSAPEVTVVVPTRDRPELLTATLQTILAQQEVELEVVVVDDGGSKALPEANDPEGRVRVLRNEVSRGVAVARNQGASVAAGRWVAFCDDDDLWTEEKLAEEVAAATTRGCSWAYTGAVKFEEGLRIWQVMPPPPAGVVQQRLPVKNVIPAGASNVLIDRAMFLDVGGFDEGLQHLADWDLWIRLSTVGPVACSPGLGVAYRMHPDAMSLNPRGILEELEVIDRRWRWVRGGEALDPAPTHLWIATSWLRSGHRFRAAAAFSRALPGRPRQGLRGLARSFYPRLPRPAHVLSPYDPRFPSSRERVTLPPSMHRLLEKYAGPVITPFGR